VIKKVKLIDIFDCQEESSFYSYCLEMLVLNRCDNSEIIVEFGSGDGMPVINAVRRTKFGGMIEGYEINGAACDIAFSNIEKYALDDIYIIHKSCLFKNIPRIGRKYLVSNPPYLPARNNNIRLPFIYGGKNGSEITKQLIELGFDNILVIISSYSDPEGIISYALLRDYHVSDFIISPIKFGYYSSESAVRERIEELRQNNMAFYSENIYLLAGTLFKRRCESANNLSSELIRVMKSLRN